MRAALAAIFLAAVVSGCAGELPVHQDSRHYSERAETKKSDGFTVTAAALGVAESEAVFGVPLNAVGIQPVWIRVRNDSGVPQWLFPIGVDSDYFPAYEVARRMAAFSDETEAALYDVLRRNQIRLFVPAGETSSGFVYTHNDEGMKAFNVELHSADDVHNFHFVAAVPGLPVDYYNLEPEESAATGVRRDLTLDEFRTWLEDLDCCAQNGEGLAGDPLNIVLVGHIDRLRAALISSHWDVTAPVSRASLWRMVSAFLFGSRYRYAPISPLYVFDREHDLAFQKARAVIDERNHMRLWLAPVTVDGHPVWVGQISRDVGVKFSGRFWPPTTHVIDPDMDDARFYLFQELVDQGAVKQVGFARGHKATDIGNPHRNAEDDPYFTDGLRAVLFLAERPMKLSEIDLLEWEIPPSLQAARETAESPAR